MRRKFGIVALFVGGIALADPVSTPNQLSDTPIISGGGSVSGGNGNCQGYQVNFRYNQIVGETAVNLSGGETLVFYGGGGGFSGGFLSTKTTYSGAAYLKAIGEQLGRYVSGYYGDYQTETYYTRGLGIGLFARNTTNKADFIAGAGGGYSDNAYTSYGGGWKGGVGYRVRTYQIICHYDPFRVRYVCRKGVIYYDPTGGGVGGGIYQYGDIYSYDPTGGGADVYEGRWFGTCTYDPRDPSQCGDISNGFHSGQLSSGASSISAFYDSYTKNYTSPVTSYTITGGGFASNTAALYVCK